MFNRRPHIVIGLQWRQHEGKDGVGIFICECDSKKTADMIAEALVDFDNEVIERSPDMEKSLDEWVVKPWRKKT